MGNARGRSGDWPEFKLQLVSRKRTLERNAFKDLMTAFQFLIPDGIEDFSPGSRSGSDENPGILVGRNIRPRQRVAEDMAIGAASDNSGTPFRVHIH